ncbi:hypothetical protein QP654_20535 [Escherichia coli]|nr:hypothetical protein [Escherichia coli]
MKFSAEELNIIRQADAIIAGKITTTDFITGADAARSLLRFRLAAVSSCCRTTRIILRVLS